MHVRFVAAAILFTISGGTCFAQDGDGFRSPSGNIHCVYFADGDGQFLRCDIVETTNRAPKPPADCDLDWGNAFEITARSLRGVRICHGDTVQDPGLPILSYGQAFGRGAFTCRSEKIGVICSNARGAGFELSRGSQRLF